MIIDNFGVFFDDAAAAANANGKSVPTMNYLGRGEAVNVTVLLRGNNAASVSMAVKLQESQDDSTFTDVASFTLVKPDAQASVLGFRLPQNFKGKFMRVAYTLTGAPAGLTVFAAVTRDHFAPYAEGQFIDRGVVVR